MCEIKHSGMDTTAQPTLGSDTSEGLILSCSFPFCFIKWFTIAWTAEMVSSVRWNTSQAGLQGAL
jgi:hypothetical protein